MIRPFSFNIMWVLPQGIVQEKQGNQHTFNFKDLPNDVLPFFFLSGTFASEALGSNFLLLTPIDPPREVLGKSRASSIASLGLCFDIFEVNE